MTNFDYIKSMSAREFFDFVCDLELYKCNGCPAKDKCDENNGYEGCSDVFVSWLNSEKDD